MMKWVTFGLVAAASLGLAGSSFADVPYSLASTVACQCVATAGGGASTQLPYKCTITPAGTARSEDIQVNVVVKNVLGAPLDGSTVTVTAVNVGPAIDAWCVGQNSQTQITAGGGIANFTFHKGGVDQGIVPTLPNLDFQIVATGPGPGSATLSGCVPQLNIVSFDLNGDLVVNLVDFGRFGTDFAGNNPRSDFNWDGLVNLVDFGYFGAHFGEGC